MTDRARTIMYTQQLDYLKGTDLTEKKEKLIEKVKKLLKSPKDEIAISFHNRDPETAPHVHVGMHFFNPRSVNQLCKILDDRKEQFTVFKGKNAPNNMWSYLFHCTAGAALKRKYTTANIWFCNFDIQARVNLIKQQVKTHSTTTQMLIAEFAQEKITKEQLLERIGPASAWDNHLQISHIEKDLLSIKHKRYLRDMKDRGITEIKTLVLAGDIPQEKKRKLAKLEMQAHAVESIEILMPDGGYFSTYHGSRGIIVELPNSDYLSGRLATQWHNLLFDLTQFDRTGTYGNHRTVPLNLEYIIFTVDNTWNYDPVNQTPFYSSISTLGKYNLPIVETDDDYQDFENDLKIKKANQ